MPSPGPRRRPAAAVAGWRERRLGAVRSVSAAARAGRPGRLRWRRDHAVLGEWRGAKGSRLAREPACLCKGSQTVSQGESPGVMLPKYRMPNRRIHVNPLAARNFETSRDGCNSRRISHLGTVIRLSTATKIFVC